MVVVLLHHPPLHLLAPAIMMTAGPVVAAAEVAMTTMAAEGAIDEARQKEETGPAFVLQPSTPGTRSTTLKADLSVPFDKQMVSLSPSAGNKY
jgi:hypothetical protein